MYFVDRNKIEQILLYMEKILDELKKQPNRSFVEKLALERMAQVLIESIIDVGNMMIDGFIMRDPGSYEDIIDILVDERVLPASEISSYKEVIGLRKTLVTNYTDVELDTIEEKLMDNKEMLAEFSSHIRSYLETELGVANAFSNNQ
ncbi:Uncharacterized conserved protein YutE, UPF0331/DUF86 family [Oceanobacillus limi]|uniref:Uncharacterized conserved protein YutE, UPF0331/DUF86 family n=1 Tax=Oceanobacillus limi TaxID=930131 RepID=A0A1I0DPI5_9BACI|nr:DUF86 domain-containing protein [Oceanobacillus limi]SET34271.1 Uncharacterized conserved protein YutE, UPF0331/DUF86 family [Oceanobacillus limi]